MRDPNDLGFLGLSGSSSPKWHFGSHPCKTRIPKIWWKTPISNQIFSLVGGNYVRFLQIFPFFHVFLRTKMRSLTFLDRPRRIQEKHHTWQNGQFLAKTPCLRAPVFFFTMLQCATMLHSMFLCPILSLVALTQTLPVRGSPPILREWRVLSCPGVPFLVLSLSPPWICVVPSLPSCPFACPCLVCPSVSPVVFVVVVS